MSGGKEVGDPASDAAVEKQMDHHGDGAPVNVGFAVMTQAERGYGAFTSKVEACVLFYFCSIVFECFVWVEDSRDERVFKIVGCKLPFFERNFFRYLFNGGSEVLEISCALKGGLYGGAVGKIPFFITLEGCLLYTSPSPRDA